jgi:hypothetical protein
LRPAVAVAAILVSRSGISTVGKRGHKGWQRLERQVCITFCVAGRLKERTFGARRAARAGGALKAGYRRKGRVNLRGFKLPPVDYNTIID